MENEIQPQLSKSHSTLAVYTTWVIATFFAFFQFFLQSATGIVGAEWQHDFNLNEVQLSNLSSAFFYTYALMQIPAGILFDHYQPRYLLSGSALILTLGLLLLSSTDHYGIAVIARLLIGVGSSFGFIGLLQVCATHFPPKRFAFMIGLSEGLTMLGVTGSVVLLTWLVAQFSWRTAFTGFGCVTFALMLASFFFLDRQPNAPHPNNQALTLQLIVKRLKIIATNRQVILGSLYGFFAFAIVNAFTSLWGIAFLVNTNTFSKQVAANMLSMVFIGIAIGGPLSGWLTKILNQRRIIIIANGGLLTIIMSLIIFCPNLPVPMLFMLLLLSGMFCSAYLQCFAVIKDAVAPEMRATALAASNMIIMLGAPILQLLIGWLLQNHFFGLSHETAETYRLSLAILPVGMLLAFIMSFWITDND
jgi:MFS family permease